MSHVENEAQQQRGAMSAVVVVPCYNEEKRLQPERFLELTAAGCQVLFVDDGSKDGTYDLISAFAARHGPAVSVLKLARNGGKAEAVRQGLVRAIDGGAAVVGYLDADLATPCSEMLRIMHSIREGYLAAMGSRVALLGRQIERRATRHYLGRVFATSASLTLGLRVYDTQCGAKAFAVNETFKAAVGQPFLSRWVFDVELLDRLLRAQLGGTPIAVEQIIEVPLLEWRDVKGSKLGPTAMARAAADLFGVAWRRHLG